MLVRIAARQSDLARLQAYRVGQALERARPGLRAEYQFRESLGDKNLDDPLWKMPEKGVFTEDFAEDLRQGRCDVVVHSWKDLPVEDRPGLEVLATLPRADVRDVLLLRNSALPTLQGATLRILSSSPRRSHNLTPVLPELLPGPVARVEFLSVRGNVPTRVRKLLSGDADALIVAKAALDRLLGADEPEFAEMQRELRAALAEINWMVLPLSLNPTAAAQGALAIEARRDDVAMAELIAKINCSATFESVREERLRFKALGGGCHQKLGCTLLLRPYGRVLSLRGECPSGQKLGQWELLREKALPPLERSACWPLTADEARCLFSRRPLPAKNPGGHLWIAKSEALPENWQLLPEQRVWCAGLETWRKLAARGVWVNGCSEGLGEDWDAQLQQLTRGTWSKLTHSRAPAHGMPCLATYELTESEKLPDLRGKKFLFWSSGSLFRKALQAYPELRQALHASGPGHTREALLRQIPPERVHTLLGLEDWLCYVNGASSV